MKIPEKVLPNINEQVAAPKINAARLDALGREIVDARPMEPPLGYVRRESLSDQIRRMVLQVSEEAANQGAESFEEANDFYIDDDPESYLPPSQYEFDEDHVLEAQLQQRHLDAETAATAETTPPPATPVAGKPKKPAAPPAQTDIEDNL